MKERPIIFSATMVRAILNSRKTQTRRVAKDVKHPDFGNAYSPGAIVMEHEPQHVIDRCCPYGQTGDRLWVRETHAIVPRTAYACSEGVEQALRPDDDHDAAIYREGWDRSTGGLRWRPSIHMPRWASRITLEVTKVRIERLQDISEQDAMAEGITSRRSSTGDVRTGLVDAFSIDGLHDALDPIGSYELLWESINGNGSWDKNPWVWVVEFLRRGP